MSEAQQHESDHARALIDRLADRADAARQREAARELVASGVAAIPALIGALRDPRAYERRDFANRINLPGFAPEPEPRYGTFTVGQRCEDLLYEIIVPPGSTDADRFKVFSTRVLQVDDWPAWWAANRAKSLAEIHEELTPLVDEYWRRHGTTQRVPTPGHSRSVEEPGMKVPEPERRFTRGPEISPVSQLLEWLDRHASGPSAALRVRLPICLVLERGARIKSARIGVGADEDGVEIRLGDSPMGISLQDRVQASRPAGLVVRAWLEGIWHGTGADGYQFTVFRLHQVIPGDAAAAADHVQVEVSDGSSSGHGERRPESEPT